MHQGIQTRTRGILYVLVDTSYVASPLYTCLVVFVYEALVPVAFLRESLEGFCRDQTFFIESIDKALPPGPKPRFRYHLLHLEGLVLSIKSHINKQASKHTNKQVKDHIYFQEALKGALHAFIVTNACLTVMT